MMTCLRVSRTRSPTSCAVTGPPGNADQPTDSPGSPSTLPQTAASTPTGSSAGRKPGRMASGDPNLQNIPGGAAYRRCFAAPAGRVLVKADYSQIELRIAAKVAGEERMIDAYRRGDDLHTLTA